MSSSRGLSSERSSSSPLKSRTNIELLLTLVSVSDDAIIPEIVIMLKIVKTTTESTIPVTVAKVYLIKSFITKIDYVNNYLTKIDYTYEKNKKVQLNHGILLYARLISMGFLLKSPRFNIAALKLLKKRLYLYGYVIKNL